MKVTIILLILQFHLPSAIKAAGLATTTEDGFVIENGVLANYKGEKAEILEKITFGEGLKCIGDSAFANNSAIKKIELVSVEGIGENAFYNYSGITEVT